LPAEIKVITVGFKELTKGMTDKIPDTINDTLKVMSLDVESKAKSKCHISHGWQTKGATIGKSGKKIFPKSRGGRLRMSLSRGGADNIYQHDKSQYQITYGSKVKYAFANVGDTDPFVIRPKRKKFLYFAVSSTQAVFRKWVIHPGGKALTGKGDKGLLTWVAEETTADVQKYFNNVAKMKGIV